MNYKAKPESWGPAILLYGMMLAMVLAIAAGCCMGGGVKGW